MDDRFLEEQRREPRPEFSRKLRARLSTLDQPGEAAPGFRVQPWLVGAAAAVALSLAFTFPAVRATAQQLLDLFRVRDFAVVQVDAARIQQLKDQHFDPMTIFGDHVQTLRDGGPAQRFADLASATAAAGFTPVRPMVLPGALLPESVYVNPPNVSRVTIDVPRVQALLDAADVHDIHLPPGLDTQAIELRRPTIVAQTFRGAGRLRVGFVQAQSPEVSLPPGLDLQRLGEIGLRVLGVEAAEARRVATSIDWRTTLVVPVVASATRFQQVDVNGARGLLLETTQTQTPGSTDDGPGHALLWTRDGRVYALVGHLDSVDMVQMAQSVH